MLTRLKVTGFKNLVDVDVRFGPFTCIAGANGAGKSNLFDAIQFLSALASKTLNEAALSIRDIKTHTKDPRTLFHRHGKNVAKEISFEVEMIVPREIVDKFGVTVSLENNFLCYSIGLEYDHGDENRLGDGFVVVYEHLKTIENKENVPWAELIVSKEQELFSFKDWLIWDGLELIPLESVLDHTILRTLADRSLMCQAALQEMQSWAIVQFEPSAMRQPSQDTPDNIHIGPDGSNLASTIFALENRNVAQGNSPEQIYQTVANRLTRLVDGISGLDVDQDEERHLLTLRVKNRAGTCHSADALSDGSLRFLAMAIMQQDTQANRLLCLEEPENGIHSDKITTLLELLSCISVDVKYPIDPDDNPLRQVIISTQSSILVCQVPDDSLLFAKIGELYMPDSYDITNGTRFFALANTWRTALSVPTSSIYIGALLPFMNPIMPNSAQEKAFRRMVDRPELRPFWLPTSGDEAA